MADDSWDEYGDNSCPMGSTVQPFMYNAAQTWGKGWSEPVDVITSSSLVPGRGCYDDGLTA